MRHWLDFWYLIVVMQQGMWKKIPGGVFQYYVLTHLDFFHDYMYFRTIELESYSRNFSDICWRELYDPTTGELGDLTQLPILRD